MSTPTIDVSGLVNAILNAFVSVATAIANAIGGFAPVLAGIAVAVLAVSAVRRLFGAFDIGGMFRSLRSLI